jgi:UDP-N-acetylmuramoyl-tripeptide--D-alanyl-D-alanine ligase
MKELGEHAPRFHADLAAPIIAALVDHAVLVGDEMTALADELGKSGAAALGNPPSFAHCRTTAEAITSLADFGLEDGDVLLVKGSNSVGLARLVEALIAQEG